MSQIKGLLVIHLLQIRGDEASINLIITELGLRKSQESDKFTTPAAFDDFALLLKNLPSKLPSKYALFYPPGGSLRRADLGQLVRATTMFGPPFVPLR